MRMDTGAADRIGLAREFIVAVPTAGATTGRTPRRPFPDEVARALADEDQPAPARRGLRSAGPGPARHLGDHRHHRPAHRRGAQVRWDCLGRYGGLAMFWHDQTKVGNYDAAIRIPERLHDVIAERQRKTLDRFTAQHGRRPTGDERAAWRCSPPPTATPTATVALTYQWFHSRFRTGSPTSTSATTCRTRPATRWPPTCCAPAPASPTSADTWARSATAWPNTMCTLRNCIRRANRRWWPDGCAVSETTWSS